MTHTQRTLKHYRDQGYICGIVERFVKAGPHGKRIDLFGFADILCFGIGEVILVQSCGSSFSEHDKKICGNMFTKMWIENGECPPIAKVCAVELIGWRKVKKKRGGKQMIWQPRIKRYGKEDFE